MARKARKEDVGVNPRLKTPALHRLARAFSAALGLAAKGPEVEKLVSSWVAAYQAAWQESLLE
jgi:hypothetical protein